MKKYFLVSIVFLLPCCGTALFGQGDPDSEYTWHNNSDCTDWQDGMEIFKVVESPPKASKEEVKYLEERLSEEVVSMQLGSEFDSELKVQIIIPVEGSNCISAIGSNGDELSEEQSNLLFSEIQKYLWFEPGSQGTRLVNCMGFIYVVIESGVVASYSIANLGY